MDKNDMQYEIIPAVNVYKGVPVIRGENVYETFKDHEGVDYDIQELIEKLKEDFKRILVLDINGINRDKPQLDLIKILSSKMELWVDGGSRYSDSAIDILVAGAEKVVLGTKTLKSMEELKKVHELSQNIILGIDYDDGIVSPKKEISEMTPFRLAQEVQSLGIEDIIFTDLKHLTSNTPFDLEVGKSLARGQANIYLHGNFEPDPQKYKWIDMAGLMIEVKALI
jgi:phosphoribosylformimino-5-aminoimidazole carboxamide ribonucleotide (ProFAR) isomerase